MAADGGGTSEAYVHGETARWKDRCIGLQVKRRTEQKGGETLWIVGSCPACRDEIRKRITSFPTGDLFTESGEARVSPLPTAKYLVTCNCAFGHAGAPDGVRGCGAQGVVTVTPRPDGLGDVAYCGDVAADERDADEWVEQATGQQLARTRQSAGQWSTVFGVVTGLVAVGAIFDADQTIYGLKGSAAVTYVVLVASALTAAVTAVLFASWAAGLRRLDEIPADLEARAGLMVATVAYCRRWLFWSKWAAVASLVLLSAAMYLRFFAGGVPR